MALSCAEAGYREGENQHNKSHKVEKSPGRAIKLERVLKRFVAEQNEGIAYVKYL
jgi:Tfp pilus assembly protein PilX